MCIAVLVSLADYFFRRELEEMFRLNSSIGTSFLVLLEWHSGRVCLPMQEMWVRSLGREDPLEKEMATHSSILAWETPWTGKPGRLQSMRSQK